MSVRRLNRFRLPEWSAGDDPQSIAARTIAAIWGHQSDEQLVTLHAEKRALFADAGRAVVSALEAAGYTITKA